MKAMVLEKQNLPLVEKEIPVPEPNDEQVLIKVYACGVCRTDLHIIDGELKNPKLPLIPGHEIAGEVIKSGRKVKILKKGDKVGIPWLGYTCGICSYCKNGMENLCDSAGYTGYTIDGGYAEYTVADYKYCFPLQPKMSFEESAPLLCAGLIGYRSLKLAEDSSKRKIKKLGIYGFGAAAHIISQIAVYKNMDVFAFTRNTSEEARKFAKELGVVWIGSPEDIPPHKLDAAIIFAPAGSLVPLSLKATDKGGVVICGGIHMSEIPRFPYSILWEERTIRSVANLTREDGSEFFSISEKAKVKTSVRTFRMWEANCAIDELRKGNLRGAAVLIP
jgi:propanol-preferring alcohol dehydrogenase